MTIDVTRPPRRYESFPTRKSISYFYPNEIRYSSGVSSWWGLGLKGGRPWVWGTRGVVFPRVGLCSVSKDLVPPEKVYVVLCCTRDNYFDGGQKDTDEMWCDRKVTVNSGRVLFIVLVRRDTDGH